MRSICQQLLGASSSHLPFYATAPATRATFRSSLLLSSHNFVSSLTLNLHKSSGFSIPSKTSLPRSYHLRFFGFKRLPSMAPAGNTFSGVKASFSSEGSSSSGGNREILVQHLLVKEDDSKIISEIQKRIVQGEDLSDLAVEYSICPSKESGGSLGWVRRGQMVPEFEEAAFGAPINKVVRCKTKFGWHLLQVLSEREESILKDIHPNELHEKLQDPSFLDEAQLIDVREPDEVAQASLPGFVVLPLRQFGSWGPEITTKFDSQKDTYVMCHHGVRSLQVAKWLQTQGFTKVYNVAGGIHAYAANADPSIPTY